MPKILCLHGHGTSAHIFKSQTAGFRSKLPPSYTFEFVSAPFPSAPSPGIKAIYPNSPTYTWFREPTPAGLREAHAWVREYVRRNGPYDAAMGFSQGCSLIGSMALYHAYDTTHGEAGGARGEAGEGFPFPAAIFICGGIPLYALSDTDIPVSEAAEEINNTTSALLSGTAGKLSIYAADTSLIQRGVGLWDGNDTAGALLHDPDPAARPARDDIFGLDYTSFPEWARIDIPTAHVYGAKDPRWPSAIQLAEICGNRVEFDHGGGHEIPRFSGVSDRIAEMVQDVVKRSG